MKRLLLDLNIFLDLILERPPDANVAAALWAGIERGQRRGMVPAHDVTTIFCLLEKGPRTRLVGLRERSERRYR